MIVSFIREYPYILAFLFGLIPALIWLFFWLKEDRHPEPPKMITLSFIGGLLSVLIVLPLQRFVYVYIIDSGPWAFVAWALIEEVCKFAVVYFIALRNKVTDEPVDDVIYLIVSALGFVAAENTLFLIDPLSQGDVVGAIITGNLRFVGASLLHIMASGTVGICMGLSFYKNSAAKKKAIVLGLILATALHTAFNLFIMNGTNGNIFIVFGAVWTGIITLLVLFEKVKTVVA